MAEAFLGPIPNAAKDLDPRSQALAWERESLKLCFDALQALTDHHVGSED